MPAHLDIITTEDLSAYVDGQADADIMRDIAEMQDTDDRCAEAIGAFQAQVALLRKSLDPVLEEPVPDRLTALLRAQRT